MSESQKVELMDQFRMLVFESIKLYTNENSQINLDSPTARHELATFIVGYLSTFIDGCKDEIDSLQFMLDEIQNSQAAVRSPEFQQELSDAIDINLARLKMMQNMKGDA